MNDAAGPSEVSIEELRRRLSEAEETLRAIREGDADALVVKTKDTDTIFSLAGGQESYRAIMEAMDLGAVALDEHERVLYANAAFCSLVGCNPSDLQRDGMFSRLAPASVRIVRDTIVQARQGRHQIQFVESMGQTDRHLMVTASPLPLAFGNGCVITFADVTARVEAAAAEESERIGQAVIASANEAVVVCDPGGIVLNANGAALAIAKGDAIGLPFGEAFPLSFPIGGAIMHPHDLVDMACQGAAVKGLEACATFVKPQKDLLASVAPLRLASEQIGGCVITLVDLSDRKAVEKRQALLMHELDHRVKNTLTMVLSICGRTLSTADGLDDFRARFTKRIQALAGTHNLLAEAAWAGVSLAALIRSELEPYVSSAGPRMRICGLERSVPPDVATAFGLVVHELATNAVKYGALSCDSGVVTIEGRSIARDRYEIVWTESGGPTVTIPSHRGFGQTLISRSLARGEGTGATVDFASEGVVCRMVIPIGS